MQQTKLEDNKHNLPQLNALRGEHNGRNGGLLAGALCSSSVQRKFVSIRGAKGDQYRKANEKKVGFTMPHKKRQKETNFYGQCCAALGGKYEGNSASEYAYKRSG